MAGAKATRWLLVGLLVSGAVVGSLAPYRNSLQDPTYYHRAEPPGRSGAHLEPSDECHNDKSKPWLPFVEVPHMGDPGQLGLGWRPRWLLEPPPREWLAGALVALVMTAVMALGLRLRPAVRQVALATALAPATVGLLLAHSRLSWLAEGLAAPWWCVPREKIFQRHAQLARDLLTAGAMASVPALVALAVLAALAWRPWRLRSVAPALAVLLLAAWQASHWAAERELTLARQVSEPLAAIETAGIRLPATQGPTPVRLPDVPLVLVSADGTLRYDDSRGQLTPAALPLLLPPTAERFELRHDEDERAPFFLLAIDERTPWQVLQRALEPLGPSGAIQGHWVLLGSPTSAAPGDPPHGIGVAPGMLRRSVHGCRVVTPRHPTEDIDAVGWLDEAGLRIHSVHGDLTEDCQQWGTGVTLPRAHLDREGLARCAESLARRRPSYGLFNVRLMPSPTTPWREVALVIGRPYRQPPRESELDILFPEPLRETYLHFHMDDPPGEVAPDVWSAVVR